MLIIMIDMKNLLCKEKNDALVEITLPKDANIYASEYKLYLPDKKLLQQKLNLHTWNIGSC